MAIQLDRRARWRVALGAVVYYSVLLVTILPLMHLPPAWRATGILVVTAVDAIVTAIYAAASPVRLPPLLVPTGRALAWSMAGALSLVPLVVLNVAYHRVLRTTLGIEVEPISGPFAAGGYGLAVMVVAICVMPALVEEIGFRRLIQGAFERAAGVAQGVLVSAILFGIVHCAFLSLPYLVGLGLWFALLRVRSGSLWPGMLLHFLHNLAVLMLEWSEVW